MSAPLSISFEGDAGESFENLLSHCTGYGVTVTTEDGTKYQGFLAGIPRKHEWYGTINLRVVPEGDDWSKTEGEYELVTVIAQDILIH